MQVVNDSSDSSYDFSFSKCQKESYICVLKERICLSVEELAPVAQKGRNIILFMEIKLEGKFDKSIEVFLALDLSYFDVGQLYDLELFADSVENLKHAIELIVGVRSRVAGSY